MVVSKNIYNLYKPLRNHLRPVAVTNAFYIIWAYINYFQFNQPIPKGIEVGDMILKSNDLPGRGVYEWELTLLCREVIRNGQIESTLFRQSFNNWAYLAGAVNKLKDFENNIGPISVNEKNIAQELRRIAHRQFPWQCKTSTTIFLRYFKIFSNPRVINIVEAKIGLTLQQWYTVGTALFGAILEHPKFNISPTITISGITINEFNKFLQYTSSNLETIKKKIQEDISIDENFVYSFNPLVYFPLILVGSYYYCPIINFLVWRITKGIYFDLVDNKDFGNPFGLAFQDYVETVTKTIIKKSNIEIYTEKSYQVKGNKKDSVDLVVTDSKCAFFVEVKTKRMKTKTSTQLVREGSDWEILAEDITQIYLTTHDYLQNQYTHFKGKIELKIFPLLVTLEDWYLMGEDLAVIKLKVKEKLLANSLPLEYLDTMPYTITCVEDYELLCQIVLEEDICNIMSTWFSPEKEGWAFGQFLRTHFKGNYKTVDDFFPGDFEKIYPEGVIDTD